MTAGGGDGHDDFDDILVKVGDFGFYQKFRYLFVLLMFSTYLGGPPTTNLIVGTFQATFKCQMPRIPQALQNVSMDKIMAVALNSSDSCNMRDISYLAELYENDSSTWINKSFQAPLVPCPNGHDFSANNKSTLITTYDLVCDRSIIPDTILTVTGAVSIIGTFVFFQLPDRIGRKNAYLALVLFQTVSGLLCVFMPEWISFTAASSLNNCTTPAMYILAIVYSLELVGPKQRALVNMIYSMWFCVPLSLIPLYAYLLPTWQSLYVVGLVPGAIFLPILYLFLDESPRWLRARGRYEEATKILLKIARVNKKQVNQKEIKQAVFSLQDTTKAEDDKKEKSVGFLDLFRHRNLAVHSLAYWYILSVTGIILAGTNLSSGTIGGNPYLVLAIISIAQLPGGFFFYAVNYVGRIWSGAVFTILCGFFSLGAALTSDSSTAVVVTFVVLAGMFSSPALQVTSLTAQEIFPTVLRATAMAYGNTVMGIMATPVPFVIYSGNTVKYLPMAIFVVLGISAGALFLFLPELWGQKLMDTVQDSVEGPAFGFKSFWENVKFTAVRKQMKRNRKEDEKGRDLGNYENGQSNGIEMSEAGHMEF